MSYREREQDEGPDTAYEPCGVCGVVQEDHPAFIDGYKDAEWTHDWEPASDNAPDERDED